MMRIADGRPLGADVRQEWEDVQGVLTPEDFEARKAECEEELEGLRGVDTGVIKRFKQAEKDASRACFWPRSFSGLILDLSSARRSTSFRRRSPSLKSAWRPSRRRRRKSRSARAPSRRIR